MGKTGMAMKGWAGELEKGEVIHVDVLYSEKEEEELLLWRWRREEYNGIYYLVCYTFSDVRGLYLIDSQDHGCYYVSPSALAVWRSYLRTAYNEINSGCWGSTVCDRLRYVALS
jgi:hypothetical protein